MVWAHRMRGCARAGVPPFTTREPRRTLVHTARGSSRSTMFVRRVGLLVPPLAAVLCLGLAGQAAATGYNPYDPKDIKAGIKVARLEHTISPNYATLDITVTKAD